MTTRKLTLAAAESCTGGLITHTLTNIPGSSAFLAGGIVAYANTAKTQLLGVPATLIRKHGAVSEPVAKALAEGARKQFNTDLALSTTGIAGPTGSTPEKPVGLVFIALADPKKTIVEKHVFTGDRLTIKAKACQAALKMLAANLA